MRIAARVARADDRTQSVRARRLLALENGYAIFAHEIGDRLAAAERALLAAQHVAPAARRAVRSVPSNGGRRSATTTSTSPPRRKAQVLGPASSGS